MIPTVELLAKGGHIKSTGMPIVGEGGCTYILPKPQNKIAVCITTRNRYDAFCNSLVFHGKNRPEGSILFVVDDASDKPVRIGGNFYRFEERAGIPRAKNKCLELAYNAGADHIFLFDDDTYPITPDWWKPYVEHPAPHLSYIFTDKGNQRRIVREIYRDDKTVAYNHVRGCMLYVERRVLDVVGGFDTNFGLGYGEHADWTNRIHNAGLTAYRVMDVVDSNKLIYSMDEFKEVGSTFPLRERLERLRVNRRYRRMKGKAKEYREFRESQYAHEIAQQMIKEAGL